MYAKNFNEFTAIQKFQTKFPHFNENALKFYLMYYLFAVAHLTNEQFDKLSLKYYNESCSHFFL